jgi:hypothetical protein
VMQAFRQPNRFSVSTEEFSRRIAAPHSSFDENSVPPWTIGDFRGVLDAGTNPPRRCAPPLQRRGFSEEVLAQHNGPSRCPHWFSLNAFLLERAIQWKIENPRYDRNNGDGFSRRSACDGLKGLLGYGYRRTVLPSGVGLSSLTHDDNRAD